MTTTLELDREDFIRIVQSFGESFEALSPRRGKGRWSLDGFQLSSQELDEIQEELYSLWPAQGDGTEYGLLTEAGTFVRSWLRVTVPADGTTTLSVEAGERFWHAVIEAIRVGTDFLVAHHDFEIVRGESPEIILAFRDWLIDLTGVD